MTPPRRTPLADHVADAVALLAAVRGTEVIPLDGGAAGRIAPATTTPRWTASRSRAPTSPATAPR